MATPMDDAVVDVDDDQTSTPSSSVPGYTDVNEFSQKSLRTVLKATRSSNDLPVGDDFDFYSTFSSVRDVLDIEGQRILSLLKRLLRSQNVKGNFTHGDTVEIDDQFDVIMDANDQVLERAGSLLDEASGIRKEETKLVIASVSMKSAKVTSWNKKVAPAANTGKSPISYSLMTAKNIQRPQLRFKDKIDNSNLPFKPRLQVKPHAIKPLEESLKLPEGVQPEDTEKPDFNYPNPYQAEIESFIPTPDNLERVNPQEAQPVTLSPLLMVDSEQQLEAMMDDLRKQKEIAVDLEHHSYRSFQGITCLIQISTRTHDYIVDTLELRNSLSVLNEVFTDPSIVKVLHGADSDVGWLQRDFGVYLVNLFDTGQAARVLGLPRFSLAYLLSSYCHVDADKQFQLADWRIRPLPAELINYAREDTHFLLYIYDVIRNQLLDRGNATANLLMSVYERSKEVAVKVFQKPALQKDSHLELYKKSKKVFNNQQLSALRDLFAWRDDIARTEDESLGYVLPNHMLLQMAEILPRERQGVLACCSPVPPLVRQSLIELHNIVLQARELPLIKPVEQRPVVQPSIQQHPRYHTDSLLNCPHDQSHFHDKHLEQLTPEPGLLANGGMLPLEEMKQVRLKASPVITAFSWSVKQDSLSSMQIANRVRASFSDPFSKFMPKDLRGDDGEIECEDLWIMKPSNVKKATQKAEDSKERKAEEIPSSSNLDQFEPEYIPPSKRSKASEPVSITASTSSTSSSGSIFRIPDSMAKSAQSSGPAGSDIVAQAVQQGIKSLREEVTAKKKKNKKALKEKEKKKRDQTEENSSIKDVKNEDDDTINPPVSIQLSEVQEVISENLVTTTDDRTGSSEPSSLDKVSRRDKKKLKKAKKLTIDEVEQNFTAFDYTAAQKSIEKQNKEKKNFDIYDPRLPSRSGKDKNKAKKPKLSGANSNKLVSFGPSMPGKGGGKKKK